MPRWSSPAARRALEREARELMTQTMPQTPVESVPPQSVAASQPETPGRPSATEIMQRSFEIARLEGQIARDMETHQQRPRRRFVGARTQEYRFARYIEDWREKIQRVGRPQLSAGCARPAPAWQSHRDRRDQVGRLRRARGGQQAFGPAACWTRRRGASSRLAAPFGAFPPDIAKDTDVLHITRTWTFTPADRFIAEQ